MGRKSFLLIFTYQTSICWIKYVEYIIKLLSAKERESIQGSYGQLSARWGELRIIISVLLTVRYAHIGMPSGHAADLSFLKYIQYFELVLRIQATLIRIRIWICYRFGSGSYCTKLKSSGVVSYRYIFVVGTGIVFSYRYRLRSFSTFSTEIVRIRIHGGSFASGTESE